MFSESDILRQVATRCDAEARVHHAQASALVKSAHELRERADALDLASDGE